MTKTDTQTQTPPPLQHLVGIDDEIIAQVQELMDERASYGLKVYVSDVIDALNAALAATALEASR